MKRENRYIVIKREYSDQLPEHMKAWLEKILEEIRLSIWAKGKQTDNGLPKPTNYVVVAEDWPMYEQTWQAIERWVDSGALDHDPVTDGLNADGLKCCPFCGNPNPVIKGNNIGDYYVICDGDEENRHCGASTSDRSCETEKGAIDRWNTREHGREGNAND